MPSAEVVEVDDFFYGARVAGGGRGRGTARQPLVAAVDRAPAGTGSCVVRVVEDCTAASYRQFGHDHLCRASTIRTDSFCGSSAGLSSFGGLDQRDYGGGDPDASLPMVHRVISNFRAMASGTFHGLAGGDLLQPLADAFSWRYSHRSCGDPTAALLSDLCAIHVPLAGIAATATVQPKMAKPRTGRR